MKYKNLLILGASGGTGQWAVKIAKERGYNVTILVRSKASLEHIEGINIIEGNVLDAAVLDRAMQGQDAVFSGLGIRRKNKTNPWSAVVSPVDFMEAFAHIVVQAMKKHGVQRLIVISAAGVGDSKDDVSLFIKFLIRSSNIKLTYDDLANMETVLKNSGIDSLSVQPVGLVDGEQTQRTKLVDRFNMSSKISKADVAQWMLDALEREEQFTAPSEMIGWN